MKRSFVEAVLTVTMIIMMSTAGHALVAPHNYVCDSCHGKFAGAADVSPNNACLTCHSAFGEAPRKPVETDAMSNYFGSASGQPATGSRSTHTWGAYSAPGHPYNPRAMVHEPTNSVLNSGWSSKPLTGKLSCFRCHDAKGTNGNGSFLRAPNGNDALCLDCHRARNLGQTAVIAGTHPVSYRAYSTVYKSNTTAYRKVPRSANSYNPTANPGNYLSSGKIVCSTCHASHYADSSSATLGNRSTANGFAQDDAAKGLKGNLQNSKGQLLRTDPIGASADAINVCSSCHKETKNLNHNAKGQNIQCNHCHGAHVDYTGDLSAPNLSLIRRDFSNMSTAKVKLGANVKVIYNTATSLRFKRADGKGICQICHTPPPGTTVHELSDTRKDDCINCHKHSIGFSAADCTSCHGQPPVTGYVGGPNGKSSQDYSLDESFTPHITHADAGYYMYACKNCHYDGTGSEHNTVLTTGTATFASVFINTTGSVGSHAGRKNVPADYNQTTRTCSTVYCHSNGSPRGGSMAWKTAETPSWENGRNKILGQAAECITCHESGATLNTNAHYKHVTSNSIKCFVCHSATVTASGAIASRTKHANGAKDVVFVTRPENFLSVFDASFNSSEATCTNSCHTNGLGVSPATPAKWTDSATGACGTCHAAVPGTSLHTMHFSAPAGPNLGTAPTVCASCHVYSDGAATHANGVVNLNAGNSCAPCHPAAAPVWATNAKVTCESCHIGGTLSTVNGFTAPSNIQLNNTFGHGKYSSASLHVKCTSCHNASAPHIRPAIALKRLITAGNALCNTCHIPSVMQGMSTARANMLTHGGDNPFGAYTTANDYRAKDCAGCHDTHGTTNRLNIRTIIAGQTVNYTNTSTGFRVTAPNGNGIYNGLCQVCHTKVKYFKRDAAPNLNHNKGKNCLSCHAHKGAGIMFAFQGAGECGGCHGYPPVRNMTGLGTVGNYENAKLQDYSGGGGAHTVAGHIPNAAIQSSAWTNCSNCHYNTDHNGGGTPAKKAFVNVIVDPQFKFNNMSAIKYNAQTCSNVSCHFKPSPNWTNGL